MKHSSVVLFGAVKERENKPRISHSLQGLDATQYTREKGKETITILNKTVDGSTAGFWAKASYSLNQSKIPLKIVCGCYPGIYGVAPCPILIPRLCKKFDPAMS